MKLLSERTQSGGRRGGGGGGGRSGGRGAAAKMIRTAGRCCRVYANGAHDLLQTLTDTAEATLDDTETLRVHLHHVTCAPPTI